MKILFIVPYPIEGPSSRYRVEQYIPYLKNKGVDCLVRSFISSGFYNMLYKKGYYFKKMFYFLQSSIRRFGDIFQAFKADIIFIHLESFPFGPPALEWILVKFRKKIVYDLDDAIYLGATSSVNKFLRFLKYPSKVEKIIKLSEHVITCNKYLANYTERFNKNVTVIHTSVDTEKFIPKTKKHNRDITIGWIGSHSTAPYLDLIKNVFLELSKRYRFNLKIIGGGDYDIGISNPNITVSNLKWNLEEEVGHFQSLDIGVYPLPENEWTLGKTGFKTIQYMSVGVPCVASRIGTNKEIVIDGVNGFLASLEEEWIEKVSRLLEDPELRKRIGLAGRKIVEENFSLKVNAPRLLEVVKSAV